MAVLRLLFRSASIYENNIVQTVASAAGTLSSIIFVLPGLVMVGWWTGFSFWPTFAVCTIGGILGVMYSVPLRRALVTNSDLPYPEGVAAAEILKVGAGSADGAPPDEQAAAENKAGLLTVVWGALASAGFAALAATRLFAGEVAGYSASGRRRRAWAAGCRWRCWARGTWSGCRWAWRCWSAWSSPGASRPRC